jgi:hypothetical protein
MAVFASAMAQRQTEGQAWRPGQARSRLLSSCRTVAFVYHQRRGWGYWGMSVRMLRVNFFICLLAILFTQTPGAFACSYGSEWTEQKEFTKAKEVFSGTVIKTQLSKSSTTGKTRRYLWWCIMN